MAARTLRDGRPPTPATLCALLLLAAGCAPRPLVERAIGARGGPLAGLVLRQETAVHAGAPGTWQWNRTFLVPDRYAWTITTANGHDTYIFDGRAVRAFVGPRLVSTDASPTAPLRSHARWTAVVNLDALRLPGVRSEPLSPAELPPGVTEGITVVFPDGDRFRLGFDAHTLLVWVAGPLDLAPVFCGEVSARLSEHRRVGRFVLPFVATYTMGQVPLADERTLAACPDPPGLVPASFADPASLPACP